MKTVGPTAALAGVPTGIQSLGVWAGRRQLFVRFAAEAETATMYTAAALTQELTRLTSRTTVHSIACGGRDTLGNTDFLCAAFDSWKPAVPVMVETDGQRPDQVVRLPKVTELIQVVADCTGPEAGLQQVIRTLEAAAARKCAHALVICPRQDTTDARILRVIEQAHEASSGTIIVVHPATGGAGASLDRRWSVVMEQASSVHADISLILRILPPVGMG
ncbi:MAG: hypothetical protein ACRENI_13280 [Gemmatimonadaceae bacterium]